jgi:hypothetical protein
MGESRRNSVLIFDLKKSSVEFACGVLVCAIAAVSTDVKAVAIKTSFRRVAEFMFFSLFVWLAQLAEQMFSPRHHTPQDNSAEERRLLR